MGTSPKLRNAGLLFVLFLLCCFHLFGVRLPMLFGLVLLAFLVAHGMIPFWCCLRHFGVDVDFDHLWFCVSSFAVGPTYENRSIMRTIIIIESTFSRTSRGMICDIEPLSNISCAIFNLLKLTRGLGGLIRAQHIDQLQVFNPDPHFFAHLAPAHRIRSRRQAAKTYKLITGNCLYGTAPLRTPSTLQRPKTGPGPGQTNQPCQAHQTGTQKGAIGLSPMVES